MRTPYVESAGASVGVGLNVLLALGDIPAGSVLEVERFSLGASVLATLIVARLLINGREDTRLRFGPLTASYLGHPALLLPAGILIVGPASVAVDFTNTTAATVSFSVLFAGQLLTKAFAA